MRQSQRGCPSSPNWKRSCRIDTLAGRLGYQASGAGSADVGVAVAVGAVLASSDLAWECCVAGLLASAKSRRSPRVPVMLHWQRKHLCQPS